MKVKIQQRSVYHKFAEIEIEIPDTITEDNLQDYLEDREDVDEKIDEAISKAEYEYGFGCDYDANQNNNSAMHKILEESEYRYQCDKLNTGGHL
jgi:hypothetical protein|tara:strand:- start:54 stop:335 length:282 start_codon:yes stop_codon:yes gene_type:complete